MLKYYLILRRIQTKFLKVLNNILTQDSNLLNFPFVITGNSNNSNNNKVRFQFND